MFVVLRLVAILIALVCSMAQTASSQDWVVVELRPPAAVADRSGSWQPLEEGMAVQDSSWISIGRRGRLLLRRDSDLIQFKSNSVASVSSAVINRTATTLVRQKFGTILFDIETRSNRRFRIETPFLSAVVKGTRFEIAVSRARAELHVERGAVETTDIANGLQVGVFAGQGLKVASTSTVPLIVTGPGVKAEILTVPVTEPVVALAITTQMAEQQVTTAETIAVGEVSPPNLVLPEPPTDPVLSEPSTDPVLPAEPVPAEDALPPETEVDPNTEPDPFEQPASIDPTLGSINSEPSL